MIDQFKPEPVNEPKFSLSNFIGQQAIKNDLEIKLKRAKQQKTILPHLLFCGPNEIGKRTLGKCLAYEMQRNVGVAVGGSIDRPGEFAAIVTNCNEGDFVVIAQTESLNKFVLEVLIQVLEESQIEIEIGKGPAARHIKLDLKPFTLICTTAKPSQLDERCVDG